MMKAWIAARLRSLLNRIEPTAPLEDDFSGLDVLCFEGETFHPVAEMVHTSSGLITLSHVGDQIQLGLHSPSGGYFSMMLDVHEARSVGTMCARSAPLTSTLH